MCYNKIKLRLNLKLKISNVFAQRKNFRLVYKLTDFHHLRASKIPSVEQSEKKKNLSENTVQK